MDYIFVVSGVSEGMMADEDQCKSDLKSLISEAFGIDVSVYIDKENQSAYFTMFGK